MKKVIAGVAVSALLMLFGCASEPEVLVDEPDDSIVEKPAEPIEHLWVQDVWLFNKISYFTPEGSPVDATETILRQLATETPIESATLAEGVTFSVFSELKPLMVNASGETRDDVDMTAGIMKFDDEEVLAILATPDADANSPIGTDDFLELDLTFLGDDFQPGTPMSFDFAFMQGLPGDDPASAGPLELLKHRIAAEQINFYGAEAADGPEVLMFTAAMGVAVPGSTRMNMSGKGKISDPGLKGFRDGAWSARKGGVGGVRGFFKKFGKGAKGSNDLINCNLGGSCNPPVTPPKPKKKCKFFCGKVTGDPHLVSLDGLAFDAQAVGEFVLVDSNDLTVQMRTEPMGSSRSISLLTGVAVETDGQSIEVSLGDAGAQLIINGAAKELQNLDTDESIGEVSVSASRSEVSIETSNGGLITIILGSGQLGLFVDPGEGLQLSGMLGDGDGNPENDLTTRDGARLAADVHRSDSAKFYKDFVDSWRVMADESLFTYSPGQSTEFFTDLSFPDQGVSLADIPQSELGLAKAVCEQAGITIQPFVDHCVFDYWASANMDFVVMAQQMDLHTGIATGEYELAESGEGAGEVSGDWPAGHGPSEGQSFEDYVLNKWNWNPHSRYWSGDEFDHFCPAGGNLSGVVWGGARGGYTSDSAVCVAAVHSGVIDAQKGGLLHVEMVEGESSYLAADPANGVTPRAWDSSWSSGFIFK